MAQVFDIAYSKWKVAYEDHKAALAKQVRSRPSQIHEITHERFASQSRLKAVLKETESVA